MIFGGRRRLGLVTGHSSVLLDHLRQLHRMLLQLCLEETTRLLLVFMQLGVKLALLLLDPLELQALLFYLLRRQRMSILALWPSEFG